MLKVRRIMRYDARHGQPYEEYETYNAGLVSSVLRKVDAALKAEQAEVRSRKCSKCGNIASLNGTCDFCG